MRAAPSSREGRAGATWRRVIVRCDLTAEPPAHCRLVSDHDLFEIVVLLDCTAIPPSQFFCSAGDRSFVPAVCACGARRAAKVKDGAQRRRRFILDRSEHRATLAAMPGSNGQEFFGWRAREDVTGLTAWAVTGKLRRYEWCWS